MNSSKKQPSDFSGNGYRLIATILLILFILFGYHLYESNYGNPKTVFYGMLLNNLSTSSFGETVVSPQPNGYTAQYSQINTGSQNIVMSKEVQDEVVSAKPNRIVTLSIGTPSTDYSSYLSVQTSQKISSSYKKIIGIWGRNSPNGMSGQGGQLFQASLLNPFLFASGSTRLTNRLMDFIRVNKVYTILLQKRATYKSRPVISYKLGINLKQFSKLLNMYSEGIGYKNSATTTNYSNNASTEVNAMVDVLSKDLISINFVGSSVTQWYSSYGIRQSINIPSHWIPLQQLKNKIITLANT
ncbi:MAG TPA: hypothetical protein VMR76_00145 [Candidatus Saccharimonadia bacterium]|nr:hypothetical protein [Candidatus Saccharimonadia bacterium]